MCLDNVHFVYSKGAYYKHIEEKSSNIYVMTLNLEKSMRDRNSYSINHCSIEQKIYLYF